MEDHLKVREMMFGKLKNICGRQYGNYKIIKRLGEGRYGVCYTALSNYGETVVIKQFKPSIFKKNKKKNAYEAVILSQLDHPDVPKLLGVINEPGLYGFVIEQMPGTTVEKMLFKQKHRFQESEIYDIGCQLIGIVKYLHSKSVVHRDIRIPNVLIHHGVVSLIDFGLSRWAGGKMYRFQNDFSYMGDFLLYLHYSTYQKKQRKSYPWYIELDLTEDQVQFYKKMLRLEEPYQNIDEVENDFVSAFKPVTLVN